MIGSFYIRWSIKLPISPPQVPTLREAVHMIARLGGFLDRKCDGEPGAVVLARGLEKFYFALSIRHFVMLTDE
jgi:hypothetical protein